MSKVRLQKQRRLTLPLSIVAKAGIHADDILEASYENGAIVLRPAKASSPAMPPLRLPTASIMDYAGSCQGAWGASTAEVETILAQDRASWDR